MYFIYSGGKAANEHDIKNTAEWRSENGVRKSIAEDEWNANSALLHFNAGSVPSFTGVYRIK